MVWEIAIFISQSALLEPALLQLMHEVYIKFSHVESENIFTVQINHVAMGNASSRGDGHMNETAAPVHAVNGYQTVVHAVEMFDHGIGHV